jgi:hypothetical protein
MKILTAAETMPQVEMLSGATILTPLVSLLMRFATLRTLTIAWLSRPSMPRGRTVPASPSQRADPCHAQLVRVLSRIFPNPKLFHSRSYEICVGGIRRVMRHIGGTPATELIGLFTAVLIAFTTFANVETVDAFPTHNVFSD